MIENKAIRRKNPTCPNCGKALQKIFLNMNIKGKKIPTVFKFGSLPGEKPSKPAKILTLKMRNYRLKKWVCWLGKFRVADGHFCSEICSGRFAKHAFEHGYRKLAEDLDKPPGYNRKTENPEPKEFAFSVKKGRLVPVKTSSGK